MSAALLSELHALKAHQHTGRRVSDLSHRCVQFDVQTLSQCHGDARVTVPHGQVAAGELKVVILRKQEPQLK